MPTTATESLAELRPGERAVIVAVNDAIDRDDRRRLLELGLFPGTPIEAVLDSPLGDPTAYRVRDMTVALRHSQARHIEVRRDS